MYSKFTNKLFGTDYDSGLTGIMCLYIFTFAQTAQAKELAIKDQR